MSDKPVIVRPLDVTAITATFPTTLPEHLADMAGQAAYVIGYQVWMEAAEAAGEGTTWTITDSTFEVGETPVEADEADNNVCAAILVNGTWYVIERDGDTVRARRG